MSDRAYLCISVCMLMCATAADGPEALAVRGAAAIPGTRLPHAVLYCVHDLHVVSTFILAVYDIIHLSWITLDITMMSR